MAKTTVSKRQQQISSPSGDGVSYEQHESHDDNWLPDASELEKLQKIDPNIIPWLLDTASKEQKSRHNWNTEHIDIIRKSQNYSFRMDRLQLLIAAFVFLASLSIILYFKSVDKDIPMWIPGTTAILSAAKIFLGFRQPSKTK